ncbi:hypothetical protein E7811_12080 [Aliigemmobacter aestuarii]|uniref:Uncharacterized protein n=1 Tax=Aliigemmobacter aestuarii TaxID=1445661 RepID=A0A4S3ML55_9RHOB|nr:hypothetical protein [Gemmobacter aestuarii]THD82886.1 hypothetical protein E7811_12080 [Gemmobacter aestuarii]
MAQDRLRQPMEKPEGAADSTAETFPAMTRLDGLLAEMEALMRVMPAARPEDIRQRADVVARMEEDMVESGFDNMPV